jgi:urea carboxylase-associated protein 1
MVRAAHPTIATPLFALRVTHHSLPVMMSMPMSSEIVPPGEPWSGVVEKGQRLRIIDLEGRQGVDFLCYNADRTEERYHAPNTLKASGTLALAEGHLLYSDEARPIFTLVVDTCGGHDTIGGCCSAPSNAMLYGVNACPGCRENFLRALAAYGMDRRDIVPNINFFCNVPVGAGGKLAETVFVESRSKAGDRVELRAEMRALAVISNCPQVNNPCNDGNPSPIRVEILA